MSVSMHPTDALHVGQGACSGLIRVHTPKPFTSPKLAHTPIQNWITSTNVDAGAGPDGWTALICATECQDERIVELLIHAGANVHRKTSQGSNVLMIAAQSPNVAIIDRLIAAGSPLDEQNYAGYTALMRAGRNGHVEVLARLLTCGANPDLLNMDGNTVHTNHESCRLAMAQWRQGLRAFTTYDPAEFVTIVQSSDNLNWVCNARGQTWLGAAAAAGCTWKVDILLQAGASPVIPDRSGKLPSALATGDMATKLAYAAVRFPKPLRGPYTWLCVAARLRIPNDVAFHVLAF